MVIKHLLNGMILQVVDNNPLDLPPHPVTVTFFLTFRMKKFLTDCEKLQSSMRESAPPKKSSMQ